MVFYFSGTGNTKWAAESLAEKLGYRTVFMNDETVKETYTLAEGERLVICFPIHGWQPPRIVKRFIKQMKITNAKDHLCFVVCTCGDSFAMSKAITRRLLKKKGIKMTRYLALQMPESYVALPFMYTDTIQREEEKVQAADEDIKCIVNFIKAGRPGNDTVFMGKCPWLLTYVVGAFFNRFMITDRPFKVDKSRCTGCGLCQKVCPVGNIDCKEGWPQWSHAKKCTSCLACYHHCPQHAINYGPITKHREQYYFGKHNIKRERIR